MKYAGYNVKVVADVTGPKMLKDWSETEYETMRAKIVVNPIRKKRTYAVLVSIRDEWLTLSNKETNKTIDFKDVESARAAALADMNGRRDIAHGD